MSRPRDPECQNKMHHAKRPSSPALLATQPASAVARSPAACSRGALAVPLVLRLAGGARLEEKGACQPRPGSSCFPGEALTAHVVQPV